jgi:hypothetical protein
MVTRWLWLWGLSSATGSAAITVTVLLVFSSVNTHCPPDRRFGQPVMLSDPAGEDSQPVPVRNRIGQCCGGSTLGSIVHGPRQHLRDEDVKSRNGSRPQTRPWRERAQGGSRSRSSGGALAAVMEPPDLRHGDDPTTGPQTDPEDHQNTPASGMASEPRLYRISGEKCAVSSVGVSRRGF